jgi:transcriptional regulator with XRE-family HTH domain
MYGMRQPMIMKTELDIKILAERIRKLRDVRGLSQRAVAEKSDVCRETLRRLELGEEDVQVGTVRKIAAFYGVTCGELLD